MRPNSYQILILNILGMTYLMERVKSKKWMKEFILALFLILLYKVDWKRVIGRGLKGLPIKYW